MAIPIQYIPEDRTAIARAQIEAEMAKTNASMWQAAQENAMRERLSQSSLAQDERLKMGLFDKEAALRQSILNQELGARAQESAAARRAEMEKFRMAKELQEREPQTQLAREQLGVYRALTPEERINKALGRDPVAEKRDAERFAFEKEKFREQARQSELDRAFTRSKWFSEESAKRTFTPEDAEKAWLKARQDISKNPLLSNVENQLKWFADIATAAPGMAPFERYLNLSRESLLKPEISISEEKKKEQGQILLNMLNMKKTQLLRASAEIEKYKADPETYQMKLMQLENDKADYSRLESESTKFLQELYEKDEGSDWWSKVVNPETVGGAFELGSTAYGVNKLRQRVAKPFGLKEWQPPPRIGVKEWFRNLKGLRGLAAFGLLDALDYARDTPYTSAEEAKKAEQQYEQFRGGRKVTGGRYGNTI